MNKVVKVTNKRGDVTVFGKPEGGVNWIRLVDTGLYICMTIGDVFIHDSEIERVDITYEV